MRYKIPFMQKLESGGYRYLFNTQAEADKFAKQFENYKTHQLNNGFYAVDTTEVYKGETL